MSFDLASLLSPRNIILFVVVFTRLSGLMTTIPLLSTYPFPFQVKTWFMASVAIIMLPVVMATSNFQIPTSMPILFIVLLKEFMIGYIIGFVSNIIFISVEIAAELLSMQMGLTAAQALNPATGDTSPILSHAYTLLTAMIFIGMNAYQWIFMALFKTFEILPPGYGFINSGTFTNNVIVLTSQIFVIGVGIALPIFSVMVIADILLGFVSKMMPKMNIFMVALPGKIYVGLILLTMLVPNMLTQIKMLLEQYLSGLATLWGG